jgi:hypothetical protein
VLLRKENNYGTVSDVVCGCCGNSYSYQRLGVVSMGAFIGVPMAIVVGYCAGQLIYHSFNILVF